MAASASMVKESIDLGPADRTLIVMPSFHIGGKNWENAQRHAGGTTVIQRGFDAGVFLRTIEREQITVTLLAPTMIESLLEHPDFQERDLRSLRAIIYSAAAMPQQLLLRAIRAFGSRFVHQYGQTEGIGTMLSAAEHRLDDERSLRRLASIGKPFRGCRVRVVDEEDREVAAGMTGELCLQGPSIMSGYWNNSAASVETLLGGWLHTGDIARIDPDGYIYLVDRKKDVIISGGENIYSLEVENAILQMPEVLAVAVIGLPDPKWGEAVCAVVVPKSGHELTEAQVIASCRATIATYKAPKKVILMDDVPRLPSGKIAKNEIRLAMRKRLASQTPGG
jgi:acyl-CoA synthetase (AMP-forming)/AMP-acid ligase II